MKAKLVPCVLAARRVWKQAPRLNSGWHERGAAVMNGRPTSMAFVRSGGCQDSEWQWQSHTDQWVWKMYSSKANAKAKAKEMYLTYAYKTQCGEHVCDHNTKIHLPTNSKSNRFITTHTEKRLFSFDMFWLTFVYFVAFVFGIITPVSIQ